MSKQQGEFDLAELQDRVAVITGAGNFGIGWGIAKHAALQLGMHVVLVDLHQATVEQASQQLQALVGDRRVLGLACDVTQSTDLEAAALAIDQHFPDTSIGAVFANAGVIFNNTILRSDIDDWQTTLNVNILGVVRTMQALVPKLQAQSQRSIFCSTASVGGLVRGDGGAAAYQASKHAVVALSESLSFELAAKSPQIHVNVLCPCIVSSSLLQSSQTNKRLRNDPSATAVTATQSRDIPLGMTPERHAEQVFDLIAAGKFYLVTDNTRPYVDHDFPFAAAQIIGERFHNLSSLELDNSDAFAVEQSAYPSSILKGPMFAELARRAQED